MRTSLPVCRRSRGGSGSIEASETPIWPSALLLPVAVTSAVPVPPTTSEPE